MVQATKHPDTNTLPPPCLTVWTVSPMPSKEFHFQLTSPQNFISKGLRVSRCFFFSHVRKVSMSLLVIRGEFSPCIFLMSTIFAQSLFNGGVLNAGLIWAEQSLQPFRCSSEFFCDFSHQCTLWGILSRPLLGRLTKFSPFGDKNLSLWVVQIPEL